MAGSLRGVRRVVLPLVVAFACLLVMAQLIRGRTAPTPAVMTGALTLDAALDASLQDGRPVVVIAHADWCPPCQTLKRTGLADAQVAEWLASRAHVVSLDMTNQRAEGDQATVAAADRVGVQFLPTMVMLEKGEVVRRATGTMSGGELLAWLEGR